MQDMEFTVEDGTLYMLQTRTGKRTPSAAFRIAVDMANEKLISKEEAIERIKPEDIERLFYPIIDAKVDKRSLESRILAKGINAVPGAAVVARCWGKCCIVGADALNIDYKSSVMTPNGKVVKEGDWLTLDGSEGVV